MPPLSDLAPAILALIVGLGVFAAAHVTVWRAHARADREAARRRADERS
jgi:hypothetical protein